MPSSRGSFWPRMEPRSPMSPALAGRFTSAIWEDRCVLVFIYGQNTNNCMGLTLALF